MVRPDIETGFEPLGIGGGGFSEAEEQRFSAWVETIERKLDIYQEEHADGPDTDPANDELQIRDLHSFALNVFGGNGGLILSETQTISEAIRNFLDNPRGATGIHLPVDPEKPNKFTRVVQDIFISTPIGEVEMLLVPNGHGNWRGLVAHVRKGEVLGGKFGANLEYGKLVDHATTMPLPESPTS